MYQMYCIYNFFKAGGNQMKIVTKNIFRFLGLFLGLFNLSNVAHANSVNADLKIKDLYNMTDVDKNLSSYNQALNAYADIAINKVNNFEHK